MNSETLNKYAPYALAVLRIVAALCFIAHGTQKLLGFPASDFGAIPLLSLFGIAGLLEIVGGLAILLGIWTRPVAFLLSGEMAYAYWSTHVPAGGIIPTVNGGDAAVLFCFVFLYLVFSGPGAWALDQVFGPKRAAATA